MVTNSTKTVYKWSIFGERKEGTTKDERRSGLRIENNQSLGLKYAQRLGLANRLPAPVYGQLLIDMDGVLPDGGWGNDQAFCNFLVTQPPGEKFQNFLLSICKRLNQRLRAEG